MQLEIGKIYTGKVKGMTQYGAFVDIDGGGSGMVHISEIANVYVSDIHDHFRQTGSSMGVATIYRQLEQLVSEGQMRKYVVESSSAACFEYIGARQGCARFIHCKCGKCGKILHIDQSEIQEMTRLLEERSGFRMDSGQTVLYGVCGDCRADQEKGL